MGSSRHVTLHTKVLARLDPKESTDRWHALFLESGLLTTVPETLSPGTPLTLLRDARDRLLGLQTLETQLRKALAPVGGFGNHAPTWAWLVIPAIYLIGWRISGLGDGAEHQQMLFGTVLWVAGAIAAGGLGWVLLYEWRARKERKARITLLQGRVAPLADGLAPAARAVLTRSFVARAGTRLVVNTPHLEWLKHCTAAARRGLGERPAGARGLEALITELESETTSAQAALHRLLEAPPEDWSDTDLTPDLQDYRRRLAELGVPPDPLCAALDEAWGGGSVEQPASITIRQPGLIPPRSAP